MDRIDFRSDTVTWPTPEMREAMATATVGDDVYGEDPTVNELEAVAAARVGKEAAVFVTSGTMGNLAAILAHAGRGDEAIVGYDAHVFQWEAAGMAALGGIGPHPLPNDETGRMDLAQVDSVVRGEDSHHPRTRLILVENSFGGCAGYPLPADYFAGIREIADRHELSVHLDGARLFNAAIALGVEASTLTEHADSVTFCLSKGLGAPAGSMLCGTRAFADDVRRIRKSLGGGMRQVGILAAAGLVAMETMIDRLADDHVHASMLAEGMAQIPGLIVEPDRVLTNIVHLKLEPELGIEAAEFARRLAEEHEVLIGSYPPQMLRAVTHTWVGQHEVARLLEAIRSVLTR